MTITLREPSKRITGPEGITSEPFPVSDRIIHAAGFTMNLLGGSLIGINYPDGDTPRFLFTLEGVDDEGNLADVTISVAPQAGMVMADGIRQELAELIKWATEHPAAPEAGQ